MDKHRLHQIARFFSPVERTETLLQHRAAVLITIAVLTLVSAAFIPRLAFQTSIHDLVIDAGAGDACA